MKISVMRIIAAVCAVFYLVVFLFAPVLSVILFGVGLNGLTLMKVSLVAMLPMFFCLAMVLCSLLAPRLPAGVVCAVSAFVPLIVACVLKNEIVALGSTATTLLDL